MKLTIAGAALAVVCCVAVPVYAQQQEQAISATEPAQPMESVTVSARRFHMEPQEFASFEYEYVLNNGDIVRFSRRVGRFYVGARGTPTVEIFPISADKFESKSGATLVFTEGGMALDIDHYERLQLAFYPPAPQPRRMR